MEAVIARLPYAPPGSQEQQRLMHQFTWLYNEHQETIAKRMERVAGASDHPLAGTVLTVAAECRAAIVPVPVVKTPPGVTPRPVPGCRARSRERRERHVARSTSGSDPGDPDLDDPKLAKERREVLSCRRCLFCRLVGRPIALASSPVVTGACSTGCWAETDLVGRSR